MMAAGVARRRGHLAVVALLIAACQPWASAMRTVVVRARPASAMVVMRSGKPTNPIGVQVGQLVSGKVIGVQPYGAFVRLNVPDTKRAPTGLLHISQISAKRVEDMESVFKVGAKVKCMVIESDPEKNRISLSTRPLESTPGEMLRDQAAVYANAEEAAVAYQEREETQRRQKRAEAQAVIFGLEDAIMGDEQETTDRSATV